MISTICFIAGAGIAVGIVGIVMNVRTNRAIRRIRQGGPL